MVETRLQSIKLGVLCGIISSLSFAIMSVFVKMVGNQLPTSMLIFFRFATSLIFIAPWILTDSGFTFKIQQPLRYIVRIIAALLALFCVFYAIKFIPLVDALLLNNTAPLFVPIIAFVLTRAKTPKKALAGIIIGFIGVAIILNPGKELFSSYASIIGLISGILAALAIVQLRMISKTSTVKQMLFYYFLISTITSAIFATIQWVTPVNSTVWLFLLCIGIFGTMYQVFATFSYAVAPVRLMSPLIFLTVVFGGLFDWLTWGNVPSFLTLLGFAFVFLGAMITVYFGHKELSSTNK